MNDVAVLVRPMSGEDLPAFRAVRLAALAEAPIAFGSTLAREAAFTEADWRERLLTYTTPARGVGMLATTGGRAVGLVGGMRDAQEASRGWVISMWVSPDCRGQRIGQRLLEGVFAWASQQRLAELRLHVTEGNASAERLYLRAGFTHTGERMPHPRIEGLMELEMSRPVR